MPRPIVRALAAAACALTLAACSPAGAGPTSPAPGASSVAAGGGLVIERPALVITAPTGYEDKTSENAELFAQSDAQLEAYLKDAQGSGLVVSTVPAEHPDLAAYVKQYQDGLKAEGSMQLRSQKPTSVGGQDGVLLTLHDTSEDTESSEYLTMRPDFVLSIAGPNSNDQAVEAAAYTAVNIRFR